MPKRQVLSVFQKELLRVDWNVIVKVNGKMRIRFAAKVLTKNAKDLWREVDLSPLFPLFKTEVSDNIETVTDVLDIDLVEVENSRKATGKDGRVTVSVEFDLQEK